MDDQTGQRITLLSPQREIVEATLTYFSGLRASSGAVIIAGADESGRTTTLTQLRRTMSKLPNTPTILAGRFRMGEYIPGSQPARRILDSLASVAQIGAAFIPLAAQIVPIVRAMGNAAVRAYEDALASRSVPDLLRSLIHEVSQRKPVVLLFDDADQASADWWPLLMRTAQEAGRTHAVLLVCSVGACPDIAVQTPNDADWKAYVRELIRSRAANAPLQMRNLDLDELRSWPAPISDELRHLLFAVGGGSIGLTSKLWRELDQLRAVTDGYTADARFEWELVPGGVNDVASRVSGQLTQIRDLRLRAVLNPSSDQDYYDCSSALEFAAVEGMDFTPAAIAYALDSAAAPVEHLFRERLTSSQDRGPGIVRVAAPYPTELEHGSISLSRYEFTSLVMQRLFLRSVNGARHAEICMSLVSALEATWRLPTEASNLWSVKASRPPQLWIKLCELARLGGDGARAAAYARLIAPSSDPRVLATSIAYLKARAGQQIDDIAAQRDIVMLLKSASFTPSVTLAQREAICREVVSVAMRAGLQEEEAWGHSELGNILIFQERVPEAVASLDRALFLTRNPATRATTLSIKAKALATHYYQLVDQGSVDTVGAAQGAVLAIVRAYRACRRVNNMYQLGILSKDYYALEPRARIDRGVARIRRLADEYEAAGGSRAGRAELLLCAANIIVQSPSRQRFLPLLWDILREAQADVDASSRWKLKAGLSLLEARMCLWMGGEAHVDLERGRSAAIDSIRAATEDGSPTVVAEALFCLITYMHLTNRHFDAVILRLVHDEWTRDARPVAVLKRELSEMLDQLGYLEADILAARAVIRERLARPYWYEGIGSEGWPLPLARVPG